MSRAALDRMNYYSDSRVRGAMRTRYYWYEAGRVRLMPDIVDSIEGAQPSYEVDLPMMVCPSCNGHGVQVNAMIDCGGLTREDFAEDPDFAEDYFSGRFDVRCSECNGRNVVPNSLDVLVHLPTNVAKELREMQAASDLSLQIQLDELKRGC